MTINEEKYHLPYLDILSALCFLLKLKLTLLQGPERDEIVLELYIYNYNRLLDTQWWAAIIENLSVKAMR